LGVALPLTRFHRGLIRGYPFSPDLFVRLKFGQNQTNVICESRRTREAARVVNNAVQQRFAGVGKIRTNTMPQAFNAKVIAPLTFDLDNSVGK
jgi:hypothetical protein